MMNDALLLHMYIIMIQSICQYFLKNTQYKGPVHFARGYVNPAVFDVPVHLEVCECHIDAKIFYPEAFFIKKS